MALELTSFIRGCSNNDYTAMPESSVRFTKDVLPVFLQNCALSGCYQHRLPNSDNFLFTYRKSTKNGVHYHGAPIEF